MKENKDEELTYEELTALCEEWKKYIEEQEKKFETPSDTRKLIDSVKLLGKYEMPTKLALFELYTEASRSSYQKPKYTQQALCEMVNIIFKDLNMLKRLRSNTIDCVVKFGNDPEAYNTATITMKVKGSKEYAEKMAGKEIHYTPRKNSDDFPFFIDMFLRK